MNTLFIAIFYIFVPVGVFHFVTEWKLPKFRVFLLSYLPLIVLGALFAVINLFRDNVYENVVFSSIHTFFLTILAGYLFYFPYLLLSALIFIKITLKYNLFIRFLIAFVIGIFWYLLLWLIASESCLDLSFIELIKVGLAGGLSALLDYWLWERDKKSLIV